MKNYLTILIVKNHLTGMLTIILLLFYGCNTLKNSNAQIRKNGFYIYDRTKFTDKLPYEIIRFYNDNSLIFTSSNSKDKDSITSKLNNISKERTYNYTLKNESIKFSMLLQEIYGIKVYHDYIGKILDKNNITFHLGISSTSQHTFFYPEYADTIRAFQYVKF